VKSETDIDEANRADDRRNLSVPNVPCPGPCLRKQRCANMMQDVDLNNDSNTNKEVNSTFFNFFEKGLCRIYAIPQGGSQSDLRSITRTSLALLKHGFTRCSVYIYILYNIYIYYIFIGCLGLYLAFIIDTKNGSFLSPWVPSHPSLSQWHIRGSLYLLSDIKKSR
jgi:hypothetical protein